MKYKIKYIYDTGDSFNQYHDRIDYLEPTWENLDIAKANLKRIKEHYEYYRAQNEFHYLAVKELKELKKEAAIKDWFVNQYDFCVNLQADNGNYFQIVAPWCGYFERLNEVEIEADESDMKILFR